MNTPVLLILFNRADTALQVLERIKLVGVKKLYLFSDGPRSSKIEESETLKKVQSEILNAINWDCEIKTKFEEENKGPRYAIGNGINWFFENEEHGIIFEHDCLPNLSFFSFCEELLAKYADDERIMHISGNNFQFGRKFGTGDYYFSKFNHIWGFATWRRAWKHYDLDMKSYPEFKLKNELVNIFPDNRVYKFWETVFDKTYNKEIETWDYQWTFSMWCQNGLAILPQKNLVSNIGFDSEALNTKNPNHKVAFMETFELLEIKHPKWIIHQMDADIFSIHNIFYPSILKFGIQKIKKLLK